MTYHINYNFVWLYFDKFYWGLLLSLELAVISILIGAIAGLLLLVYFVFYGVPTVGGFKYGPTLSFIITLSIYSAAYLVEIFRAGLDAVPKGQIDAGKAIGLTPRQRLLHVRLPTMFRVTLPALGNQFVSLFKDTSFAYVIAVPELTYAASWLSANKFRIFEGFSVAAPMYLAACTVMFAIVRRLERRYAVRR